MSSVTKPVTTTTTSVASSRPAGGSARQISSSNYGAISELAAQTGVRSEDESRSFENYNQGQGDRHQEREQPRTLKLNGTSRTFALLFEDTQQDYDTGDSDGAGQYNEDGFAKPAQPAFQAYMERATSTYDTSIRAVNGEWKSRGGSLNIAM